MMIKMYAARIVPILLSLGLLVQSAQADNIAKVQHNNRDWSLPTPEGFCDTTEDMHGITMLKMLNDALSTQPIGMTAVSTFVECKAKTVKMQQPQWGYIALQDLGAGANLDQESYNKHAMQQMADTEFMNTIMDKTNKDMTKQFEGLVSEMKHNVTPTPVHSDENSLITFSYQTSQGFQGEKIMFAVGNTIAMQDTLAHVYIYKNLKDMKEVPPNYIPALIAHAKELKARNSSKISY